MHGFFYKEKFLYGNAPQKPKHLLRKSPASIAALQFLKTLIFPGAL